MRIVHWVLASGVGLTLVSALASAREPVDDYGGVVLPGVSGYGGGTFQPGPGASGARSSEEARSLGASWLVRNQSIDGGWAAGGWGGAEAGSDVATTAVSVLALRRDAAGSGRHADAIGRGVQFILRAVETAPKGGPLLNTPQGTQPQYKLGPNVDTHLASVVLTDVSGQLDAATNRRVLAALDVVIGKIQSSQAANGAFEQTGWAPAISSSFASQGLSRAKAMGRDVDDRVLTRNDDWQRSQVTASGSFDASAGAGVSLYAVATGMANATAAEASGRREMAQVADQAAVAASPADAAFVGGFGSLGGEEVLSYGMISDSLHAQGDARKAADWDERINGYLTSVQNADGSWSGHHCITSTPFTTAASVLTLGSGRDTRGRVPVEVDHRPSPTPTASGSWWGEQPLE